MLKQKKPKLWISTYDNITHLLTRHTHKGLLHVKTLLFEELLVLRASGTLRGLLVLQPVPFYSLVSLLLLLLALLFYWDYSSYVFFIWRIHKINGIENIISGYIFMRKKRPVFCEAPGEAWSPSVVLKSHSKRFSSSVLALTQSDVNSPDDFERRMSIISHQ